MAILKGKSIIESLKYDVTETELKSFIEKMNNQGYWEPFGSKRTTTLFSGDKELTYHIILEKCEYIRKKDL